MNIFKVMEKIIRSKEFQRKFKQEKYKVLKGKNVN